MKGKILILFFLICFVSSYSKNIGPTSQARVQADQQNLDISKVIEAYKRRQATLKAGERNVYEGFYRQGQSQTYFEFTLNGNNITSIVKKNQPMQRGK
jgi:hypothetical protein